MAMFERRRENKQNFDESRLINVSIKDCNNVDGHIVSTYLFIRSYSVECVTFDLFY